ncbi:hypothetical protein HRbin31_00262 [bacterium HR31]|nr:hypothetical protein HRbin31_00262 [bacterium HR31]
MMYAMVDPTGAARSVSPSGLALSANQLLPRMVPPPGMFRTRTDGLPAMCFSR